MDFVEEIKLIPPVPGSCLACAGKHDPKEPHDKNSLYYQNGFYRKYKRFPSWDDAMSHCTDQCKQRFRKQLQMRGIILNS